VDEGRKVAFPRMDVLLARRGIGTSQLHFIGGDEVYTTTSFYDRSKCVGMFASVTLTTPCSLNEEVCL